MDIKRSLKKLAYSANPGLYSSLGLSSDIYFFIRNYLSIETSIIIEVGAHFGIDTRKLNRCFPESTIYAIEPDPRNYQLLTKGVSSMPKIVTENIALSDKTGTATFYQSHSSKDNHSKYKNFRWIDKNYYQSQNLSRSGASSLVTGHPSLEGSTAIQVQTERLDDYAQRRNLKAVNLLWIDVQGAESKVLDGASALLPLIDYIWIEYGFIEYDGGMTREETIAALDSTHRLLKNCSDSRSTGNLFFQNHRLS